MNRLGKYLGVKIDFHQNKKEVYKEIVDRIQGKLNGWKAQLLSQAGRFTLAQSVLQSIPIYQFSTLAFPKKYTDKIDSLTNNFFWGYKNDRPAMHLLKKSIVFSPKNLGGTGLRFSHLVNQALLAKQVWKFHSQPTSVLSQWISSKYFKDNMDSHPTSTTQPSWVWKSVQSSSNLITQFLWWRIGNAKSVPFRSPFWWSSMLAHDAAITTNSELIDSRSNNWNSQKVQNNFPTNIATEILGIPISVCDTQDVLIWSTSPSGSYQTSYGYSVLFEQSQISTSASNSSIPEDFWQLLWKLKFPKRIQVFLWKLFHDALPTSANLHLHHLNVTQDCLFCHASAETTFHLFFDCPFARSIWFGSILALRTHFLTATAYKTWLIAWICYLLFYLLFGKVGINSYFKECRMIH